MHNVDKTAMSDSREVNLFVNMFVMCAYKGECTHDFVHENWKS